LVIFEQCQAGRSNDCPEILGNGEKCGHKCNLNTADISPIMDESLRQQQAEQEKIEAITPNKSHIA
jgi:hypothetical protein